MDEDCLSGKPRTQLSILVKSKQKIRKLDPFHEELVPRADYSWLYPIILPSIFPALFSLYKENHSRDDHNIWRVIGELNGHGDEDLSGILEVRK